MRKNISITLLMSLLVSLSFSCGQKRSAAEQEGGSIEVPEYPYLASQSLGLKSLNQGSSKSFYGQLLIWNDQASPETVQRVVQTLSEGNKPRIAKYEYLRDSVLPAIEEVAQVEESMRTLQKKGDPGQRLFEERLELSETWFSAKQKSFQNALTAEERSEEEIAQLILDSQNRFGMYCEAKIWQRAFLQSNFGSLYSQRPTPLAMCEPYYKSKELLLTSSKLCADAVEGKSYNECLWFEGVIKTSLFEKWFSGDVDIRKLSSVETYQQLAELVTQDDSLQEISAALLSGQEIVGAAGNVLVPSVSNQDAFPEFTYKKCRRYRPGCRPTINVKASKVRSIIDYIESDHRVLLFSQDLRGSNGIGPFAEFDVDESSLNEIYFNAPFLLGDVSGSEGIDYDATDAIAIEMLPGFPVSVFDQSVLAEIQTLESKRDSQVEAVDRDSSSVLAKDLNVKRISEENEPPRYECQDEKNLNCPIQLSDNKGLKLAIQKEVSNGFYRAVTLNIRKPETDLELDFKIYKASLGFSDNGAREYCLTDAPTKLRESVVFEDLNCSEDRIIEIGEDSGEIAFEIELSNQAVFEEIGFDAGAVRPPETIDLLAGSGGESTQTLDFNLYTEACSAERLEQPGCEKRNVLIGSKIVVKFVPFKVAGLYEKMSGSFTIESPAGETIVVGNLSLTETESSNFYDQQWESFRLKYLERK